MDLSSCFFILVFSDVGVPVWFVFAFAVSKVMTLRGTDLLPTVDAQPVWLEFRESCAALAVRWWRRGDCGRGVPPLAFLVRSLFHFPPILLTRASC